MSFLSKLFGGSSGSSDLSPTERALSAIVKRNEAEFLAVLAQEPSVNVNDMSGGGPMLALAIHRKMDKAVLAILARKPNVNLADVEAQMTPLHVAVVFSGVSMVQRLISEGADVHALFGKPKPIYSCLYPAVKNGNLDMMRVLLEAGAKADCDMTPDATEPNDRGVTPLVVAVCNGNLEMMRLLIKHGANVNYWAPSTVSPLMNAAFTGQLESAKLLVEHGAIIELASVPLNGGAYEFALRKGHKEVARWLWSRSKPLQAAYSGGGQN